MTKSNIKAATVSQKKSDDKRGVKVKGFKLHTDTIEEFHALKKSLGIDDKELFLRMLASYKEIIENDSL